MANIWDGIVTYLTWATTSTNSFNIPRGTGAVTIITPNFTTDTTCTIEGLDPIDGTSWVAVESYDPGDATVTPVVLPEANYIVIPASALGAGTFRLTNTNTQAGLRATVIIDRIV